MRKNKMEYSFLCKGLDGYWIYRVKEYEVDGSKKKFTELSDRQKEYLSICSVSGRDAWLLINALNEYSKNHLKADNY